MLDGNWRRASRSGKKQEAKSGIYLTLSSVCVICFHGGLSVFKSYGGAKIKFVGESFNAVEDVGEGKNCGGA